METVLIWLGSGFAFSFGVYFGAWSCRRRDSELAKQQSNANDLLLERNVIGLRQAEALEQIAKLIESEIDSEKGAN